MAIRCEMGQRRFDFRTAELARVSTVAEDDETTDSGDILLFGAIAIVTQTDRLPHLVEQARGLAHVGRNPAR
jgi:hypothetical protein